MTAYKPNNFLPEYYDGTILPELEEIYFKQRITEKNKWIVNNSDIIVCFIRHNIKSGAFRTVQYAKKKDKPIIYL